jgi:putative endonuclease
MRSLRSPAVYILASRRHGTLYVGVTSDLLRRVWEHKTDVVEGFSRRYQVHMLVYFEMHETIVGAIAREKQIKKWSRLKKIRLIESTNPRWKDLYGDIL